MYGTGGFFLESSSGNTGNGTSNNTFSYTDTAGNTYDREINAALNNITFDHQGGTLAPEAQTFFPSFVQNIIFTNAVARLPRPKIAQGTL